MTKLFLFTAAMVATSSANARIGSVTYECEKNVILVQDRTNNRNIVNGEVLKPNRTQRMTIGEDAKGYRYEFDYTNASTVRQLRIFKPLLGQFQEALLCREVRGR